MKLEFFRFGLVYTVFEHWQIRYDFVFIVVNNIYVCIKTLKLMLHNPVLFSDIQTAVFFFYLKMLCRLLMLSAIK
jgi:hypothetical protein